MIRLARKPSLWVPFFGRIVFAIVCAAAVAAAWYFVWKRHSILIFVLADVIAIGAIWELIRAWRAFRLGAPVVEIDRQPLTYGDSAQLRVAEAHTKSIAELGAKLIGECYATSATDISSYREKKVVLTRCYEEELLRLKPEPGEPLSRLVQVQLPKSPPADGMTWKIVVDAHLKRGVVVEHPYPLHVRETA
jgi:hypothetical protein